MSMEASRRLSTWDRIAGPGASPAENILVLTGAGLGAAAVLVHVAWERPGWGVVAVVVVTLMAADIGGGVIANATPAGSRWWHRPGQGPRQHLLFVAAHVHPWVLALLVPGWSWQDAAVVHGTVLAASVAVVASPRRLRRPVAMGVASAALVVLLAATAAPAGVEWVGPLLVVKLVIAHLVPPPGGTAAL